MPGAIDPHLPQADIVVLDNLLGDVGNKDEKDAQDIKRLQAFNDHHNSQFQTTVFATWDEKDIPRPIYQYLIKPYINFAQQVVRHPTDVIFVTHIIIYFTTNLPSALFLYYHFTWIHGVLHALYSLWCMGAFTLMMHQHIHNNGVLSKRFATFDRLFPYILEPLMGHTWDSYYYHHVKHHHVEGNGPEDLSSTVFYQRDELSHFLCYVGRFLFLIWFDLPLYFLRKGKTNLAIKAGGSELLSYAFFYTMSKINFYPTLFVFIIPFAQLRLGLMIGNWGQHALVDEVDPDSDFRSSITLIDVPSNRYCFNDGYHTSHHLNPLRHWREHPVHFLQSKDAYSKGGALVFHNIDYLMMTVKLLQKDYMYLANCLVRIGDQVGMSQQEIADMLRTKTRRFTQEDIQKKFPQANKAQQKRSAKSAGIPSAPGTRLSGLLSMLSHPVMRAGIKEE